MATTQLLTIEDLIERDADESYELIEGVLQEVSPAGVRSGRVATRVLVALDRFVQPQRLGVLTVAETGHVLANDPDTVVMPDVAFTRMERFPNGVPPDGISPIAPDLAVEVISPTDRPGAMTRKQRLYEAAGVPLVWWVDPGRRTITVHAHGTPPAVMVEGNVLDGGEALPGFTVTVVEIFNI